MNFIDKLKNLDNTGFRKAKIDVTKYLHDENYTGDRDYVILREMDASQNYDILMLDKKGEGFSGSLKMLAYCMIDESNNNLIDANDDVVLAEFGKLLNPRLAMFLIKECAELNKVKADDLKKA